MKKEINVFLVDDSSIYRRYISTMLISSYPHINIIETAVDGKQAIEKLVYLKDKVDVVILDIVMPLMDGIQVLSYIMDRFPKPVVLISSLRQKSDINIVLSELGFSAFESGRIEFVKKPDLNFGEDKERFDEELARKVESISKIRFHVLDKIKNLSSVNKAVIKPNRPALTEKRLIEEYKRKIIVIAASTGGPKAFPILLSMLPTNFPAIVLVQHMPLGMIEPWTERLQKSFPSIKLRLVRDGTMIHPSTVYISPQGKHCIIQKGKRLDLEEGEKINFVIPSADLTFASAANVYGQGTLGIILTGMGQDGRDGSRKIKEKGGKIIAEDETTCTIFAMPEAVIKADLADKITPLDRIITAVRGLGWI